MSEDDNSKTEEPTEKRLSKAREDGNVPISQEVKSLLTLIAALVIIATVSPYVMRRVTDILKSFLEHMHEIPMDLEGLRGALVGISLDLGMILALPVGLMVVLAIVSNVGQVGFLISSKKLEPKLDKINPISGLKKLFDKQKIAEFLKSILKVVLVGTVAVSVIYPNFPHPDVLMAQEFSYTLDEMYWLLVLLTFTFCAAFALLAAADWIWTRWTHRQKLKMTRQEVKDEHKQAEGDPMVKGRIRSLRMRRVRERMMQAVPTASVVVTNPTHYAVALKYDMESMAAPKLVAKGVDFLAKKIRESAEDNDVPIVENPPLARALYASVELDQDIPPDHYKAVAEVIGFVMRQRQANTWRPTPKKDRAPSDPPRPTAGRDAQAGKTPPKGDSGFV